STVLTYRTPSPVLRAPASLLALVDGNPLAILLRLLVRLYRYIHVLRCTARIGQYIVEWLRVCTIERVGNVIRSFVYPSNTITSRIVLQPFGYFVKRRLLLDCSSVF